MSRRQIILEPDFVFILSACILFLNCSSASTVHCDDAGYCEVQDLDVGTDAINEDGGARDADPDIDRVFVNVDLLLVLPTDWSNSYIVEFVTERGGTTLLEELLNPTMNPDTGSLARPAESLHIGVTSMDLGVGGYNLGTCVDQPDGDQGVLLISDERSHECWDATAHDCEEDICPWILIDYAPEREAATRYLWCTTDFGPNGCAWEQPLESAIMALTDRSAPGQPNDGFLREDAVLAVIFIIDEDDCSVSDLSFFDPNDTTLPPPSGPRCMTHPERLFSVESYFNRFSNVGVERGKPLVLTGIIGIPNDGLWVPGDPIEQLYALQQIDPESPESLMRLECGAWYITPSPRIAELITMFGDDGYMASICEEDWSDAFMGIARTIQRHLQ